MDHQAAALLHHACSERLLSFLPARNRLCSFGAAVWCSAAAKAPDPYAPFNRRPLIWTPALPTSWRRCPRSHHTSRQQVQPKSGRAHWCATSSNSALGRPHPTQQRAALDSAWQQFTAFEGTRIAVNGIDSVLATRRAPSLKERQDITDALSRFHQHFPAAPIPHVDMGYTGYNYSVYPTDELLLFGCEFFIGSHHPAVKNLPPHIYPGYMQERMVPEHLVGRCHSGAGSSSNFNKDIIPAARPDCPRSYCTGARCCSSPGASPRRLPPHDLMDWTPAEWQWAARP